MKNISTDKEAIELAISNKYIIIDPLYVNDIKLDVQDLAKDNVFSEIRRVVFPYTDTPFAEYISKKEIFTLEEIEKVHYDMIDNADRSMFSTDSGVILFIKEDCFIDFISKFDYDELTDSSTELLNLDYWRSLSKNFDLSDCAIIVSPGIKSGVEFDGSGTYKV